MNVLNLFEYDISFGFSEYYIGNILSIYKYG